MAVEDSVAQDQLRAFIDRIERMEGEKASIASDIKEIYAEAKGNGFDTKILRKIVAIRKQDANERMEQEALLDLYMSGLGMIAAPHEDDDYTPPFGSNTERTPTIDQLVERMADQIDPELLKNIIEGSKTEAGRKIIMDALAAVNGDVVSTAHIENIEPQPTKAAGSDLAASPALSGQVADIPDIGTPISNDKPEADDVSDSDPQRSVVATREDASSDASGDGPDKSVETQVSAAPVSMYAEPGVITWESAPPEGVKRSPYGVAFGTFGQDLAVIEDDLQRAASAPIVKIGAYILDGWARFMKAREMFTEELRDGIVVRIPLEYPVVQYNGTDPLIDCIKLNVEGRLMTSEQKYRVAQALTKIEPARKNDIYAAFELGMELVA